MTKNVEELIDSGLLAHVGHDDRIAIHPRHPPRTLANRPDRGPAPGLLARIQAATLARNPDYARALDIIEAATPIDIGTNGRRTPIYRRRP